MKKVNAKIKKYLNKGKTKGKDYLYKVNKMREIMNKDKREFLEQWQNNMKINCQQIKKNSTNLKS